MPRARALAYSRKGTRTVVDLVDDYAFAYAPFIRAAVRDVGHNFRQGRKLAQAGANPRSAS